MIEVEGGEVRLSGFNTEQLLVTGTEGSTVVVKEVEGEEATDRRPVLIKVNE